MRRIELDHFVSYKAGVVFVPLIAGILALLFIPNEFPFGSLRVLIGMGTFFSAPRLYYWFRNRNFVILRSPKQFGLYNGTAALAKVNLDDVHSMHWAQAGYAYPHCKLLELRDAAGQTLIGVPIPIYEQYRMESPIDHWGLHYLHRIEDWVDDLREHVEGRETFDPAFDRPKWELLKRNYLLVFTGIAGGLVLAMPLSLTLSSFTDREQAVTWWTVLFSLFSLLSLALPFAEWQGSYWYESLKARVKKWRAAGLKIELEPGEYPATRNRYVALAIEEMPRIYPAIRYGAIAMIALLGLPQVMRIKAVPITAQVILLLLIQALGFWALWAAQRLFWMLKANASCTVVVDEAGMIEFRPESGPPLRYSSSEMDVVWRRVGLVRLRNDAGYTYALFSILDRVPEDEEEELSA